MAKNLSACKAQRGKMLTLQSGTKGSSEPPGGDSGVDFLWSRKQSPFRWWHKGWLSDSGPENPLSYNESCRYQKEAVPNPAWVFLRSCRWVGPRCCSQGFTARDSGTRSAPGLSQSLGNWLVLRFHRLISYKEHFGDFWHK